MPTDDRTDFADCIQAATAATFYMDANDADALVRFFTEDLEFVRPATYPEVAIRGRADLHATIAGRDPNMMSRHVVSNFVPRRIAEDEIEVRSYFTHFRGQRPDGSEAPIPIEDALQSMGEYRDTLRRVGGRWLIARRVARFIFNAL